MRRKLVASCLSVILSIIAVMQPAILGQAVSQPQFGTWDAVKAIPPGDEVEMELKSGKKVKGEMTSVSDGGSWSDAAANR
jgi:hypothetical protein